MSDDAELLRRYAATVGPALVAVPPREKVQIQSALGITSMAANFQTSGRKTDLPVRCLILLISRKPTRETDRKVCYP